MLELNFSVFRILYRKKKRRKGKQKMAKFRESGYVNDFVMFRNACEERKLKYTLSHIDKMKVSYNRQQDKEKLFFAVQHLSVPANRKIPPPAPVDATISRSRSYSAPLQNDDKVDDIGTAETVETNFNNPATTNMEPPKNETLLTKRRRSLTLGLLPSQENRDTTNKDVTNLTGQQHYGNTTATTNAITKEKILIQLVDDGSIPSSSSGYQLSDKHSSPNLPHVTENKLTKSNIARLNRTSTIEDQAHNTNSKDKSKYKNHHNDQQKQNYSEITTRITINDKPITNTTATKRNKNLLTVNLNGHHQNETSKMHQKSKQRFLSLSSDDGTLSPLGGSCTSRRASALSIAAARTPSRHESVSVYSDAASDFESSVFRSRLKEKQKEKDLLRELIKRKKTVHTLTKSLQDACQDNKSGNETERIKRTSMSNSGLTTLPAKEEWQRRLETMKGTNQDLTRREKQAIEERVRNRWKDAFDNMKSKRLSIYQSKMSISCGEENSKTFVKFLPKSKQAFYIKDVQFAQKFL